MGLDWLKRAEDDGSWTHPSLSRQIYIVALSTLVMAVQVVDRQVLSLVLEPLRKDLGISDFQISLLGGLAFSLFYAACAIPIGRLIDGGRRPTILAIGMLLWSCATLGTGLSSVFGMLFAFRVAVAVGEATGSPCSIGMITDIFVGRALARAIVLVMLGVVLGQGIALIGGGFLLQLMQGHDHIAGPFGMSFKPWQVVYLAAGVPGLILAPLIFFTIKDPPSRLVQVDAGGQRAKVSFKALWAFVGANRGAVGAHAFGYSIWSIGEKSLSFWAPTYLIRAYHLPVSKAGYLFGTIAIVVSVIGNLSLGWLVDVANRSGKLDAALRVGRNCAALSILPVVAFPFMPNLALSVACIVVALICTCGYMTVTVSQQQIAPNQVRAQYNGLYLLVSNIFAGVIGTSLVALVTEHVFHDRNLLGYSLALVCGGASVIGAVILTFGLKPFAASVARLHRPNGAEVPA